MLEKFLDQIITLHMGEQMDKYAYTYEIYRHTNDFVGPFDTWEAMMKSIEWMVMDDETSVGDRIQDALRFEPDMNPVEAARLRIFKVSEEEFDDIKIAELWRNRLMKEDTKRKRERKRQQEERDKAEYQRLKEKYESENK